MYVAISTVGPFYLISATGMLANTHDVSFAAQGLGGGSTVIFYGEQIVYANEYDAGSEVNSEFCTDISGSVCQGLGAGVRITDGAEGFEHIHAGIHG